MIKINYTAYLVNNWKEVLEYHLPLLKMHIIDKYDSEFNMYCYPFSDELTAIVEKNEISPNIKILDENKYEYPAIYDLIENPYDINLYMHTKGVSKDIYIEECKWWNKYMTHFNVECCDDCIKYIKDGVCDCCGCEFHTFPWPHYSGNFWWSSKNHLIEMRKSQYYNAMENRYIAEQLVGSVPGTYMSLCESHCNLYYTKFTSDKWIRNDIKIKI